MDQPAFQQAWGHTAPLSDQQNVVAQYGDDSEDLSRAPAEWYDYEWNDMGCSQIATDVPHQAVPLLNPQPYSNPEPQSGLARHCYAEYAASSSIVQPDAELPRSAVDAECQFPTNDQSFQQNLLLWPVTKPSSIPTPYSNTNYETLSGLKQALTASDARATQRLGEPPSYPRQKSGRCVKCWALGKPCKTDGGNSRCSQCVKLALPIQICSRERLTQHKPFDKWKNETYIILFTSVRSSGSSSRITVDLRQFPNGPTLNVECYEFLATYQHQTRVLQQNSSGWHSAETTAYCLTNTQVDISAYVQGCVEFALSEACALRHPVAFFFQLAQVFKDTPIIRQCLEMYTTLCLMRIKWQFSGDESLGMAVMEDRDSAWYGIKPVPRMIQNQLGHLLELNMIDLDRKAIKGIQALMEKRERRMWVVVTLAVFLLLHTREVDAGRNIFWSRYIDPLGFWIHPSKPRALIDEAIVSCNSLLAHFHCMIGRKPLDLNWDDRKSQDMVDKDPNVVKSMKLLQAFVLRLKEHGLIGQKACDVYKDGKPNSVGFTISSLMFEDMKNGCEVKGFS